ncbi:MAG: molecular chaperone HtpG [SAR324 cluster bacterium]|nr:molecular chaperone HtpG [SAR324 cluster bacterium]
MNDTAQAQEYEFQAEMSQLLHLITHSLYSHREIFLRELVSNSSDALNKLHFASLTDSKILGDDGELQITIVLDEEKKSITISDNGVGMTKDELIANIGTIASSGTSKFMNQLTGDKTKDIELIGRFGVGFYAVFMVSDEVIVESLSFEGGPAHRWVSAGTGKFTIEECDKATRGTSISFTFKEDAHEFASKYAIENTIKKYSDFVNFPIVLNEEKTNQSSALWTRPKEEVTAEEHKEFFQYLSHKTEDPTAWLHLNIEAPVQFRAVLYVPTEVDKSLFNEQLETKVHLYVKRVFIQSDCKELLPQWLRFVNGVVDSEDLTLNVSREVTQNSPIMAKINKFLVKKLISEFTGWAESDKEKYTAFYRTFGNFIKEGIHTDHGNKDKLIELYRAASSTEPEGLTSLQEYVDRMGDDQKQIFYVFGKTKSVIETNPNLEYFKRNNLEVIYLYDEVDDFIIGSIGTYKEKEIVPIDKADIDLSNEEEQKKRDLPEAKKGDLIALFKKVLKGKVEDVIVSKRLVDSPCSLVSSKDGMNVQMERMMKMMDQNFKGAQQVFEINTRSSLIRNMSKIHTDKPNDKILKDMIMQLFEEASLMDGKLEDLSSLVPRSQSMMTKLSDLYAKSLDKK